MMRGQVSVAVCAFVLPACLGSCGREQQTMNPENVLVLRLGGNYESLSARLQRPPPGIERRVRTAKPLTPPPRRDDPPAEVTLLEPDPPAVKPKPTPTPQPAARPPRPDFHVVTLAAGQTLYGLCRTELGNGGRWQEVARLNGWSAAEAARLPAGQKVKLPVR